MPELDEYTMERVLEEFEQRCYDNMNHAIETEEGLGIEYDEDVVCDVCQSPDGEDGNEMVFCDKCNICVHQVSRQQSPERGCVGFWAEPVGQLVLPGVQAAYSGAASHSCGVGKPYPDHSPGPGSPSLRHEGTAIHPGALKNKPTQRAANRH